jgi:hypothetical protein
MAIRTRVRFEIFKRDDFMCGYCGRRSPEVVLQVDHIVAIANGGTDDPINLTTACWECNSGKSAVPLGRVLTGEDPYDKAIEILERSRQLEEYNRVVTADAERRLSDAWDLALYWERQRGRLNEAQQRGEEDVSFPASEIAWFKTTLQWCPREKIREFMDLAIAREMTRGLRYVAACARNWREERTDGVAR